ncbi:MAG: hypothetical protein DMF54_07280 [Acidobacteria bacterium]|nr:MAG: hypothetical protein DMF54_07280 [Acidobacteriota bacterium]
MNCPQARFLLYAHLDRELSRNDAEELARHLALCGPCAARADSARGLAKILRSRLDRASAPPRLRSRLQMMPYEPARPRPASYFFAAAVALLIMPLVADAPTPRGEVAVTNAAAAEPLALVSKRVTGTLVCVRCEARREAGLCPLPETDHVPGLCADNGEIWRLMTREHGFGDSALGRSATIEGTAFPRSGFLRANRVGY